MQPCYTKTIHSCYLGYVIQAIVNNFVPLLLVTFQAQYHIRLEQATLLLSVNFIVQLLTDLFSSFAIRRAGYRRTVITAHALVIIGFAGLICLPEVLPSPFAGLLASVIVYAVGGGLLEVLLSPIIEALPTESKEQSMSLLHSFYCWGQASFILVSSLFFSVFTVSH